MTGSFPEKIVFVGGVPRSGTTVTHALICTGSGISRYQPELSFFRSIPAAYQEGIAGWKDHTSAFFADPEAFRRMIQETAEMWLQRVADAVGNPRILCVKDPNLTHAFPAVRELLPASAYFVTVCRHPYDVVLSMREVQGKMTPEKPYDVGAVRTTSIQYLRTYERVIKTNFGGRHFMFRYEDLGTPRIQEQLAKFVGVERFFLENLWQRPDETRPDKAELAGNPWGSPKYFQPLDLKRRHDSLPAEWQAQVKAICGPIMERMNYS